MKEIINTIKYDYPHMGGIQVLRGRKRFVVERQSNWRGSLTGIKLSIEITPKTEAWDAGDWWQLTRDVIAGERPQGVKVLRRGFEVR